MGHNRIIEIKIWEASKQVYLSSYDSYQEALEDLTDVLEAFASNDDCNIKDVISYADAGCNETGDSLCKDNGD